MCPPDIAVKEEEVEVILPGDATPRGAKAKHEVPKPSAPSKSNIWKLPKVEDDNDDVLTSLCALFDDMWPGDADDDNGTEPDDNDTESDDSEPESPRSRGTFDFPLKTYFMHGLDRYFFDQDHNVFLEDENGTTRMIHRGRAFPSLDDNLLDFGFINGLPYFFGIDGSLYYSDHTTTYPVSTWIPDPMANFAPSDVFHSPFTPGHDFNFSDISQFPVANGDYCENTGIVNPNPPQGQHPRLWSPSSSSAQSPLVSAGSRASSSEPLEPPLITTWKEETKVIQGERNYVPASKLDRRRCRHCNKIFRRPSSLEDHMNVHTGAKPHICPYERCNTGFATKSNMKRHFVTHRVGKLEDYRRGKGPAGNPLTATYNAKAFHTQRFRLVPS